MLQQWASIEVLEAKPGNAILERMLLQAPDNWPLILKEVKDTAREGVTLSQAALVA